MDNLKKLTVDAKNLDNLKQEVALSNELEFDIHQPVFKAYKERRLKTGQLTPIKTLDSFVMIGS